MDNLFPYYAEPELEEIMNDPIVKRLMQKDGIEDDDIAPLLRDTMRRLHIEQKHHEIA